MFSEAMCFLLKGVCVRSCLNFLKLVYKGYKAHTDCTESSDKRDRVATVLVYLDTVEEGGETEFTGKTWTS